MVELLMLALEEALRCPLRVWIVPDAREEDIDACSRLLLMVLDPAWGGGDDTMIVVGRVCPSCEYLDEET